MSGDAARTRQRTWARPASRSSPALLVALRRPLCRPLPDAAATASTSARRHGLRPSPYSARDSASAPHSRPGRPPPNSRRSRARQPFSSAAHSLCSIPCALVLGSIAPHRAARSSQIQELHRACDSQTVGSFFYLTWTKYSCWQFTKILVVRTALTANAGEDLRQNYTHRNDIR